MSFVPGSPSVARGVAISTGAQLGARGIHFLLNVVSSLALIRYLSPEGYGELVLVYTMTSLIGLISDFGLFKLAVREASRDGDAEGRVIGTTVVARLLLSLLAAGATQIFLAVMGATSEIRLAAGVFSLMFVTEALLTVVVSFHIRLEQQYEAFVRVAGELIETILILWLISRGAGLVPIVAAPVIGGLVAVSAAWLLATRRAGIRPAFGFGQLKYLLREALPIGPALIIAAIYLKLGAFGLILLRPTREVGLFGAAFQPIEYLLLASAVLINVLFPVLVRYEKSDKAKFVHTYQRGAEALVAALLPTAVLLTASGPAIVRFAFGADYLEAASPLVVLAWALPLLVISVWNGFLLLALDRQIITFRYQAVALAAGLAAHAVLIPTLGLVGAALGTLATALVVSTLSTAAVVATGASQGLWLRLGRIMVANALLIAVYTSLHHAGLSWWVAAVVAGSLYPIWLLVLRVVSVASLRGLTRRPVTEPRGLR